LLSSCIKRARQAREPDNGRDGKQPSSLRPDGLRADLSLWAAGYVPVGRGVETGTGPPRWPQIVSAVNTPDGIDPAARPIPPGGDADEHRGGHELVG
jgi:hypothetical protein